MALRTKWTLDSFGDDEAEHELPQLKDITRSELADPDFDSQTFLIEHCQFRTLKDVQSLVKEWESKLEFELSTTVNSDFDEFLQIVESTRQSGPSLENLKQVVSRFGRISDQMGAKLNSAALKISQELEYHRSLSIEEARAQKLLHLFDLLEELENTVPDLEPSNFDNVLQSCKLSVAVGLIARELESVKAVSVLQVTISGVFSELRNKLDQSIALSQGDEKLDLLAAREFMREARSGSQT